MAHFIFVYPPSLTGPMTTHSTPRTIPLTCLEDQPHYATLITHAPHFLSHLWYFMTDLDRCTSLSYIWPIIHSYCIAHLCHFIYFTNPTQRPTNGAPTLRKKPHLHIGYHHHGAPISVVVHPNHPHILLASVQIFF